MAWSAVMGFVLFSIGNGLAIAGLTLAALGYASGPWAVWIVGLVAAGEFVILGSVSFLGDEGYQRLEARAPGFLQRGNGGTGGTFLVTPRRRALGLALLLAHVAMYMMVWVGAVLSYTRATEVNPFPAVWGLPFDQQGRAVLRGVIAAELLFVVSIFVLGPAWWGRFKQLFRYQSSQEPRQPKAPSPPPTLRYRLGLTVFVIGNLLAMAGLLLPALGLATGRMVGVVAIMLAAGEIISWCSIFLLGKEGFSALKTRLFALLKRTPSGAPVSQRRHRIGCALLGLHVVAQFAALVFPIASHYGVTTGNAFPEVLGLARPEQLKWFLSLLLTAELLFFAGVYTLGADWWDRFRNLFAQNERGESP